MQTRALVDFGEASLNRAMRLYGPVGDLSVRQGTYYPSKAPLLSYAAVPIYWVLRQIAGGRPGEVPEIPLVFLARVFLTALPTLVGLLLVRRLLETYCKAEVVDLVVTFYALGTLAFSYSLQFLSHQTSANLLLAAFFMLWRWSRAETRVPGLLLAGALAGLAVTAEYTSAMPAGLLAFYAALSRHDSIRAAVKHAGLFAAGAIVPLGLLAWYHTVCFGGPLETGYRHLADAAYQPWHLGGFLGIRTPAPRACFLSLFSPLRGLLLLSPGLVLAAPGLREIWRQRREHPELAPMTVLVLVLIAAYLYFTSSFTYDSWGWTTGPRHMTGLLPFLLLPIAFALQRADSTVVAGVMRGLLASSILVTGLLTLVNYIPDNVSEALFGLFLPLTLAGDLVPSVPVFLGMVNPWSGGVFLLVILCAVGYVGFHNLTGRRVITGIASLAVVAGVVAVHAAAYGNTDGDRGARNLLSQVWFAPPGVKPCFWCTSGRP